MLRQHLAQRSIRFCFVLRQFGDNGGRRRDHLAQKPPHHPISALHRAGSQTGRTLRQEHGHREPGSADREILSAGLLDTPIEITGNGALGVRGLLDEAKIQSVGS